MPTTKSSNNNMGACLSSEETSARERNKEIERQLSELAKDRYN